METIRTNWAEAPPHVLWRVPLTNGFSSFAVSSGRAFTLVSATVSGQLTEYCLALEADTGRTLWSTPIDEIPYYDGTGVWGVPNGPRSTPTVDGGWVYTFSAFLRLNCLNATNGQVKWSKDLESEYDGVVIGWQNAASPLIVDDLILVNSNGRPNEHLMALRKDDGSLLVSVVPETGAVLWRYAFPYNGTSSAASPVVGGDLVYCSAAYTTGSGAARVTGSGTNLVASQAWRKPGQLMNHWCTPVYYNGHLYGMYGQNTLSFRCVELATGTQKWPVTPDFGYGSVLVVSGKILAMSELGDLVLVEPNPDAYTEIARISVLAGHSWNVPAISNGRIYARSTTEAVCLDVATAMPTNRPPNAPTNLAPLDGATNQPLTLTLQASAFSDPDGDSHASSQWVIKRSSDNATVFDSGNDTNNKTSITVPAGVLSNSTAYSWSVAYTDSKGAQGPTSTPATFTTLLPPNGPPNAPTDLSPPDGATNQPLTLTLQAGAFSDPDGDSHASSQWVIKRGSDNALVFDSGNDTNNKTSITVPAGVLSNSTTYSWSVSYTDNNGAQGPASTPATFTTLAPAPVVPLELVPRLAGDTGVFQLLIGTEDASPLGAERINKIDVFATADLTTALTNWDKLTDLLVVTNGQLRLDDPERLQQRFYRVEERP